MSESSLGFIDALIDWWDSLSKPTKRFVLIAGVLVGAALFSLHWRVSSIRNDVDDLSLRFEQLSARSPATSEEVDELVQSEAGKYRLVNLVTAIEALRCEGFYDPVARSCLEH